MAAKEDFVNMVNTWLRSAEINPENLKTESIKFTDKQINWERSIGILLLLKFVLIFPL